MDLHLERYNLDKPLNEKYGPVICKIIGKEFDHCGETLEEQFAGGDLITKDGTYVDLKWSQYVNDNIDVETRNEHHAHKKAWWAEGNFEVVFIKRKSFDDKFVYVIHTNTEAIRQFAKTTLFSKRREFNVSGNGSFIKNFSIDEFIHNTNADISCMRLGSADIPCRESKYPEVELHRDEFVLPKFF